MRKLIYIVATTVDGFIADVDHGVAAFLAEGDHATEYLAQIRTFDTVVMGRGTYEFGLQFGVTDPYPWAETIVFGRFDTPPDARVRFTSDDPTKIVAEQKLREGSPIYLCGGGKLARALFDAGLVDELVVKQNPSLLGAGIPLTAGLSKATRLRLRSAKVHDVGVVVLRYDVNAS